MVLPGEDPAEIAREENVWRLLSTQLRPDQGRIWRAATYRFHALVADRWRQGDVFLLGDAAHQTPPFMGQGLNQGLRDAGNLCWKIAEVFHGRASSRSEEHTSELQSLMRTSYAVFCLKQTHLPLSYTPNTNNNHKS